MSDHQLPLGASPGFAYQEKEQRRQHYQHVEGCQPRVMEASRRLQNALDIRTTDPWPIPSALSSFGENDPLLDHNGRTLRMALYNCAQFGVRMDRGSAFRDFLDATFDDFQERKVLLRSRIVKANSGSSSNAEVVPSRTTKLEATLQACQSLESSSLATSHQQANHQNNDSNWPDGGIAAHTEGLTSFPDPLKMSGSFTATLCAHEDFRVSPVLTLTLRDVVSPLHSPTKPRCILLRHFEVGLDGVEGIVHGQVIMQETISWKKRIREPRLGKLGLSKLGDGGYSKELDRAQRAAGWGQGRWLFFGVKFKPTRKDDSKSAGRWFCFGAPIEAVERLPSTEQLVMISGGGHSSGNDEPLNTLKCKRLSNRFSLGGAGCMDHWYGEEQWEDSVFGNIHNAMANVGLLVESLHPEPERAMHGTPLHDIPEPAHVVPATEGPGSTRASAREMTCNSTEVVAVDRPDESQVKRKRSSAAAPPRERSTEAKRRVLSF